MIKLELVSAKAVTRDLKQLTRRNAETGDVVGVLDLIAGNTAAGKQTLKARHRMHPLTGYDDVYECHVDNAPDMLLVWRVRRGRAYILRLGPHDKVLGKRSCNY